MRTAKKASKAKTTTKPKGKAPKAAAKAKSRAAAKGASALRSRPAAPKRKTQAAPKPKGKAAPKAKAAPKVTRSTKSARAKSPAKAAPRKAAVAATKPRSAPARARKPAPRRDGLGRLNPKYARDLRALSQENNNHDDDRAFFKAPRTGDDLAEELGEEAVETMTSGADQSERLTGEEEVEEERGGPFVRTRGDDEFADGTDRSNPLDATREPFPRT
jgi:hypothetical protein